MSKKDKPEIKSAVDLITVEYKGKFTVWTGKKWWFVDTNFNPPIVKEIKEDGSVEE